MSSFTFGNSSPSSQKASLPSSFIFAFVLRFLQKSPVSLDFRRKADGRSQQRGRVTSILRLRLQHVARCLRSTNVGCSQWSFAESFWFDGSKDNQLAGVIGGSGGMNIIPAVTQVFLNHFVLGMEPLDAVEYPRVYHRLIPNVVLYENCTCINGDHIELADERKLFLKGKRS